MIRDHLAWRTWVLTAFSIAMAGSTGAHGQTEAQPQKEQESYAALHLANSGGVQDANEIQTALRNLLPRARLFYTESGNVISIRGSAQDIALAQKMLPELDQPQKSYRLTYTIGEPGNGGQHAVVLVTPGTKTILKRGTRVPVVVGAEGGSGQNVQIQYVDIGLSIEATLDGYGEGMRLRTKIEQSTMGDLKSVGNAQDPVIQQSVVDGRFAVLPGKPLVLGSVDLGNGKSAEVSVIAEAVK